MLELMPSNLMHWMLLLWWALVRPDHLKEYESGLSEQSRERLIQVGSWMVSTLTWLPLLLAVVWISRNQGLVVSVIAWEGFDPWFEKGLPLVFGGVAVLWLLTALFGYLSPHDDGTISARNILLEAIVGLGVAFAAVGLASVVTLSRVDLGIATGVAVTVAFGVSNVPAARVVRAVAIIAAFAAILGTALSAAFDAAYTPVTSGLIFLVAFTIMAAMTSAVDNSLESGQPSWVGRATFVALVLSYGMLLSQLAVGLIA